MPARIGWKITGGEKIWEDPAISFPLLFTPPLPLSRARQALAIVSAPGRAGGGVRPGRAGGGVRPGRMAVHTVTHFGGGAWGILAAPFSIDPHIVSAHVGRGP